MTVVPQADENSAVWLRLLLDSTSEGFYTVNRDGETTLCNATFLKMLGFAAEADALGRKLHDVIHHTHPDGATYEKLDCPIYQCAQTGTPAHITGESFYRLDGVAVPVEYWARPIVRDGVLQGAICTFIDVTQRRADEAALADALAAKDALLEEVNHRVKNSLQLVLSLLALQNRQLPDGDAKQSIADAMSRISVVASVHQELYKNKEHGSVDIGSYLSSIIDNNFKALNADDRVRLTFAAETPLMLGIERAVPLALIMCEVVTNSLKYGFAGERAGAIDVDIQIEDDNLVVINVRDTGPGLPSGFDFQATGGLGMRIIRALARQIRSEVRYSDAAPGTSFQLRMPFAPHARPKPS